MKRKLIYLSIPFVLLSCNNSSGDYSVDPTQNYEVNKMSLEDQEKSAPLSFLSTDGTYRENLLGGKMVIEGTIRNSASIATYKDVVLEITFYSKTKSVIGSEQVTVYEYIKPNSVHSFKFKVAKPAGTNSLGWNIVSAQAN